MPWRSSGGGRRAWLTTKASQAAKWREVNKKLSETIPTKKAPPPKVLTRLDPKHAGIRLPGQNGGRVAFSEANAAYELRFGDHVCVVGDNAAGKACWWKALSGQKSLVEEDDIVDPSRQVDKAFMFMSFSMHGSFLEQHRDRVVADVLGGSSDPLARRLIVQLGLYPLWYKKTSVLSTGEIRKVLLAHVLSKSPKVLVLDKPFDGLDAPSRKSLKGVLSQLCQGFPRLLVDLGLSRRSIDRTSMVLITHRDEEVPDEVTRLVAVKDLAIELEGPMKAHRAEVRRRLTHTFPSSTPSIKLPKQFRPQVPRAETLRNERTKETLQTMLEFSNVRLQKGDHVLLEDIDWKVKQGQVWALKGKNGAGKSTLTRLILEAWSAQQQAKKKEGKGGKAHPPRHQPHHQHQGRVAVGVPRLGLVSTETHLHLAATCRTWPTSAVILSGLDPLLLADHPHQPLVLPPSSSLYPTPPRMLPLLEEWGSILGLSEKVLATPFGHLSQGQQKLAVIARALVAAPSLLVFDEACQGLDSAHRTLVLSLLSNIVKTASSWITLLYITHHEDEALSDVTTHVLELEQGRVAYCGRQEGYAGWYAAARAAKEQEGRGWGIGGGGD